MYFLLSLFIRACSILILLVPAFFILHFAYFRQFRRTGACFLLGLYFAGIYTVTGLPTVQFTTFEPNFYLIPLVGILFDIRNSILNTILFIPLGLLIPIFCSKYRSGRAALMLGLTCSLFIELAQMFTYRLSDINDLLTNTLGTYLGFRIAMPVLNKKAPSSLLSRKDLYMTAVISVLLMYFLQPQLGQWLWTLTA